MNKRKYWIIGIGVTLLLISGIGYGVYVYQNAGIQVMIMNKTGKSIHGLEIQLSPGATFITLPEMEVGQVIEEAIDRSDPNVKMREQVWIVHKSTPGSEVALGYIDATYRGKMEVVIHKLEESEREVEMAKLGVKIW
jgi:hypothetical protein